MVSYKWKARQKGLRFWNYFSAKKRAVLFAGAGGEVKRRKIRR